MLRINVNDKEYKIRFGYRVLCDTDIIDNIMETFSSEKGNVKNIMEIVAELLLAGLQKYHSEDFGYKKVGKEEALKKVYELMDDYEDESTVDNPQDCFELFEKLQKELFENGFFKRIRKEEAENRKKAAKSTKVLKKES